jgi:hypothetical protein
MGRDSERDFRVSFSAAEAECVFVVSVAAAAFKSEETPLFASE